MRLDAWESATGFEQIVTLSKIYRFLFCMHGMIRNKKIRNLIDESITAFDQFLLFPKESALSADAQRMSKLGLPYSLHIFTLSSQ